MHDIEDYIMYASVSCVNSVKLMAKTNCNHYHATSTIFTLSNVVTSITFLKSVN